MNAAAVRAFAVVLCVAGPSVEASRGAQRPSDPANKLLHYRMRAARADSAHARTVERAGELARLAGDLALRVAERGSLGPDDARSVEQIRRLARQVRTDLGGLGAHKLESPPRTARDAVAAIEERSCELWGRLDGSTRFQVDARLITLAGEVVALSEALRALGSTRR